MVAGSFTRERTSPIALERLWKASVLDIDHLVPKIRPDHIATIKVLEGDGGVGTIKEFHFGPDVPEFKYVKHGVEVLDEVNHVFKFSVIEGGLIGLRLKSYSFELKFDASNDGSTIGKVKVEYDTLNDALLSKEEEDKIASGVLGILQGLEGYLLADPTACT